MQGNILNKIYQIKTQLSKRGSRATWLAKNLNTNEAVVVKILKFGFDAEWQDFKLFEREAQTLKNISHPAIPKYLDYFELDLPDCKGFTLVQEYIAAPSLEETIRAGRSFSESEIREIATALLDVLLYLHQQQPSIIHRDIKPSNVLLTNRSGNSVGQVYPIDFGAVKSAAAVESGTITVVGTYGYMPPEQFGGYTTPASDLYSLGATLIYLATGRHPTELPSKDGKIVFSESVQLSYSLIRWLEQTIEPSCDRRFKSATEALQSLKFPLTKEPLPDEIVKQPIFSRIVLQKSPEEIDVLVPSHGSIDKTVITLTCLAIAWNSFTIIWMGAVLSMTPFPLNLLFALCSIPFWTAGLSMVGVILFTLYGKTRLKINSQRIALTYECLGIKYQKHKATARENITAIECAGVDEQIVQNGKSTKVAREVVVWANGLAYSLSSSVKQKDVLADSTYRYNPASIELNWLAHEISAWLNLPLT